MKTIKLFLTMLVCVGIIFSGIVPGMYIYANPDTVLLAAPTNLTAEIKTPTQVLLNWNFINSELANIYIERKSGGGTFEVIAVISGGTNVYTDSGLAPNTTYIYQVKAVYDSDAGESAYSNTVSATTPPEAVDPPSRPTNLTAAAVSSAQINLSWTKTGREDGYEIERKKIGGNYEIIGNLNGNTTTYTDSGLAPGATYYYRIRSHNSGGYSPFSNEATATTPSIVVNAPAKPSNLTAVVPANDRINLTWNDNANDESGFKIERKVGNGNYVEIMILGANTTSYSDLGLSPNASYSYRVSAYNGGGNSGYSNEVSVKTEIAPSAPTNLSASVISNSRIELSWTDRSNNETGFKIERKTGSGSYEEIATVGANKTGYTDTGLSSNATYTYRIRAYNSAGNSGYSNEVSGKTGNVPSTPTNLSASVTSNSRIELSWTDRSNNETGFKIERKTGSGSYEEIATVGANKTGYTDTGLSSNATYTYRIRAYNSAGNSGYSNEVSGKTGNVPSTPTNLSASVTSNSRIELSWTDRSNNETGFKIERKTGSGSYEEIATVGANKTGYTDTGLSSNVTYTYRIRAYNSAGNSGYSNEVSGKTGNVPSTPTNLSASVTSNSRIELSWTDRSNNETGFKIERKTGSGSYEEIATVGANKTGYTDTGLSSNVTYTYRIRAYNSAGNSGYSNVSSANIPIDSDQIQIRLYIGNTVYYVEDELKEMDAAPIIREGRTLLPIKYVAEAIGAKVAWSNTEKKVTVTQNKKVIELWIDRNTARVDGKRMLIDPDNKDVKPIIIPPGRTMVPLRFIVENLGCKVDWNGNIQEVKVTYPQN
ncbi:fibronectin type III domain-containing protein [Geosporobacter ferrireducens]|uniref:Fibronectin type-III domain-containing protein n=1 Tax=Geosporobacter ferrireducens TaxID=1424294 RepID=A0A1D8GNS8_9FIRM|nr:fibronectin type III domain-containing protein [Geosporobacter ferrireducens]AOT72590.1 hypothetical protein Gferi_25375 [Geosporobacter ferrireducens]